MTNSSKITNDKILEELVKAGIPDTRLWDAMIAVRRLLAANHD
ncbi:hypothetical protein [Frigoribacterium sp. RIT-PI-h]|nr:hypothetical protein [Frigoribacterium sp. RIT-PI-h]